MTVLWQLLLALIPPIISAVGLYFENRNARIATEKALKDSRTAEHVEQAKELQKELDAIYNRGSTTDAAADKLRSGSDW